MKKVLFILLSMALPVFCHAQNSGISYTKKYGLDFEYSPKDTTCSFWVSNAAYNQMGRLSLTDKDGKFGEKLLMVTPMVNHLRSVIRNRILLPETSGGDKGKISLEVKGVDIENLSMRVIGLDYKETALFDNTLTFVPDTFYSKLNGSFPLANVDMIDVTIDTKGEKGKKSEVFFSGLTITINGKPIDDYPMRDVPVVDVGKNSLICLRDDFGDFIGDIKELGGKKIIGLGESVHNNDAIDLMAFRIMSGCVNSLGCNLLIVEIPISISLFYNRYVSDSSFVLPDNLSGMEWFMGNKEFLENLRLYNSKNSPDKCVRLFGMDYNTYQSDSQNPLIDIFDFLTYLNTGKDIEEVDRLCLMLYYGKSSEALEYLKSNIDGLGKVVTKDELECIEHILSFGMRMDKDNVARMLLRDSIMMENISFLEKAFAPNLVDRIVVYGHAVHTNILSSYPVDNYRSTGSYLKEKYGDQYASFLLSSATGLVNSKSGNVRLQYPCPGSIEYAFVKVCKSLCYVPMTAKNDCMALSRFFTQHRMAGSQFFLYNLYRRYDGVFFVKRRDAGAVGSQEFSTGSLNEYLEKEFSEMKQKLDKRKAIVNEIKSRIE